MLIHRLCKYPRLNLKFSDLNKDFWQCSIMCHNDQVPMFRMWMLGSLEIGNNIKRRDLNVETLGLLTHERVLRVSLLVHTYDSHNPYWCSLWCTIPNVRSWFHQLINKRPHECTCLIKFAHKSMWNFLVSRPIESFQEAPMQIPK
jgi:hypothetical protein